MTPINVISDLLRRADLPGDGSVWIGASETAAWPRGTLGVRERAGLVSPAATLSALSCEECDEPHAEHVLFQESASGPGRPFIPCPANGRVFLEPEALRRWRFDCHTVAKRLAAALETGRTPREVVAGRCWSLGPSKDARPSFLIRGARWPNARAAFEGRLAGGSNAMLYLLASDGPPPWHASGDWIPLIETLRIESDEIHFDFSAIASDRDVPCTLRRRGSLWNVVYQGKAEVIPHRIGLLYLAQLLQHPGRAFPALELVALAHGHAAAADTIAEADVAGLTPASGYETADLLDAEARDQYRRRIDELDAKKSSVGLTADEETERQALRDQLGQALGVGGRPRKMAGAAERARSNVWHALERAYDAIEQPLPPMAQYLRNSIDRGSTFTYRPHEPISWSIHLGGSS